MNVNSRDLRNTPELTVGVTFQMWPEWLTNSQMYSNSAAAFLPPLAAFLLIPTRFVSLKSQHHGDHRFSLLRSSSLVSRQLNKTMRTHLARRSSRFHFGAYWVWYLWTVGSYKCVFFLCEDVVEHAHNSTRSFSHTALIISIMFPFKTGSEACNALTLRCAASYHHVAASRLRLKCF